MDLFIYDIRDGSLVPIITTTTANEVRGTIRGSVIAWLSDASGRFVTNVAQGGTVTTATLAAGMHGHSDTIVDYTGVIWTDGRYVSSATPDLSEDYDLFYGLFNDAPMFPSEASLDGAAAAQVASDLDSMLAAYTDYSRGDANVRLANLVDAAVFELTTHAGTQADPTVSGNLIVWEDNRRGVFDIYHTTIGVGAAGVDTLIIDEVLADPNADANGDGVTSPTEDEFVEIINALAGPVDLSGVTLSDATGVRFTFPDGTVLPTLGSVVVFGGGTPTGLFGGAQVFVASGLGLNNTGDTITLSTPGGAVITTVTYGTEGGNDESLQRSPALSGTLTRSSMIPDAVGTFSPGTSSEGFPY